MEKGFRVSRSYLIVWYVGAKKHPILKCKETVRDPMVILHTHTKRLDKCLAAGCVRTTQRISRGLHVRMEAIDLPPMLFMVCRDMDNSQSRKRFVTLLLKIYNLGEAGMLLDIGQGRDHDQSSTKIRSRERFLREPGSRNHKVRGKPVASPGNRAQ
jgi:hypothetical protein